MNNDYGKLSFNLSINQKQILSIVGLYIFSFGSTMLGFGVYLTLEALGVVEKYIVSWSGQGFLWGIVTICISLFFLFIPTEFFRNFSLINRSFNDLLTNIITVIGVSVFFLLFTQVIISNENLILREYQLISRSVSFSGFITIPLLLFVLHNITKNMNLLSKYSYSLVLFVWILSNQIFL